jgi:6,7-dimethyl-8-ribityllumazine synthase
MRPRTRPFGIVAARWNETITNGLVEGALRALEEAGQPEPLVVWATGSWEIPLLAQSLIEKRGVVAVAALGCIFRGQTSHAELLAREVSAALMRIQLETRTPIAWGILTPATKSQALARSANTDQNRGYEAVVAALESVEALRAIPTLKASQRMKRSRKTVLPAPQLKRPARRR